MSETIVTKPGPYLIFQHLAALLILISIAPLYASTKDPAAVLDTGTVRKLYMDGDFNEAILILETGLKEKRPFNHEDSVFIFKHLGVMYAASYETREKGKYYMHQLLMTEPTARILDMFASDMIYMIFKNIKEEFDASREKLDRAKAHVAGNQETHPETRPVAADSSRSDNTKAYLWVGGATALVAVGVTAFFLLGDDSKTAQAGHSF
jgi:hypothetical protein